MNYNNKNQKETIENDELNIKSHLNTSLDLSGISVSEDLINRTLAAIKEQSVGNVNETEIETETKELGKKIIPWNRYVRGFAGVAAAVIIVAIGYNIIQQGPIGMKKAEDQAMPEYATSQQENTTMMATTEEAPAAAENAADTSTAMKKGEEDIQYTITAETADTTGIEESKALDAAEADNSAFADSTATDQQVAAGSEDKASDTGLTQRFATVAGNSDNVTTYSFRDIFLSSPEQAEYVTITDNTNNISITLTQLEDIQAFYVIMDSHQFTSEGNDSLIDPNYTVEINSPELGTLYTMLVGSNLTVRLTQGDNVVENIYYAVDDATFKQELEEFLIERSE